MSGVVAAVHSGRHQIELRELPRPAVEVDTALLRVEAAGMCGYDIASFARGALLGCVMGHENVGRIEEIGEVASRHWGVGVGDRVVLEEYLPCGHCRWCRTGDYRLCYETDTLQNPHAVRFGGVPVEQAPGLWGGYSQYLHLPARSILHRIADHVPAHHASLTLPLANGVQWALLDGGAGIGSTVVVMGPGQLGLGCVVAAVSAGAGLVICTGLTTDAPRLAAARRLGAHHTVDVQQDDLEEVVADLTGGKGADVVIDASSSPSSDVVADALRILSRALGTVVMQGKGETAAGFPLDLVAKKCASLRGARGHSTRAVATAIGLIESGSYDLDVIATHTVGLPDVAAGLELHQTDETAIHVTVDPWQS